MSVRGKIKQRKKELDFISRKAKEEKKQDIMLDCLIRTSELNLLLKDMKKR